LKKKKWNKSEKRKEEIRRLKKRKSQKKEDIGAQIWEKWHGRELLDFINIFKFQKIEKYVH